MKGTSNGRLAVFIFLVGIPVVVDIMMLLAIPRGNMMRSSLTIFMLSGCLAALPFYFAYRLALSFGRWIVQEIRKF